MHPLARHLFPHSSHRRRAACLCLLLLALCSVSLSARAQVSKEYQVKAVQLFRLSQFVEWPTNRFSSPQSPVIIGVLGANPFGNALHVAVQDETSHGRPIQVRQLHQPEEALACHVVFICSSEQSKVRDILSKLAGRPVLTVSDMDDFARGHGGMVRFVTAENRVTLRIHVDRAKEAGLTINSRLLRMVEIVKDP